MCALVDTITHLSEFGYVVGELIGTGTCSDVYTAVDTNNNMKVALVIMNKREHKADLLLLEIIKGLNIPYLVPIYDIIYFDNTIILVEQLAIQSANVQGQLSSEIIHEAMIKFGKAAPWLYERNLRHEDMHLRNVGLFDEKGEIVAKYIDMEAFGCCWELKDVKLEGIDVIKH